MIPADGLYLVVVMVAANSGNKDPFTARVRVDMHSPDSAVRKYLILSDISTTFKTQDAFIGLISIYTTHYWILLKVKLFYVVRAISPSLTGRCSRSTR